MKKFSSFLTESVKYKYNKIIDYTYIKVDSNIDKIKQICNEAKEYKFYSVCVKPEFLSYAKGFLDDSDVQLCSAVSFPDGKESKKEKINEIDKSIINGADDIDMVIDYNKFKKILNIKDEDKKEKQLELYKKDLYDIVRKCHSLNNVNLKVIIETSELSYDQIKIICDICVYAGVDYIQTSTGYKGGIELDKIKFMRKILPDNIGIKASGGIRTLSDIQKCVNAGADRIGTSVNPYLY